MPDNPPRPKMLTTVAALRDELAAAKTAGRTIGLVPTMGALHEGHLSLVRASCEECDRTVVSIFVNPTQFGPHEDFDQYPRTLDADLDALAPTRARIVFAPAEGEVYSARHATTVEVAGPAEPLEGQYRPGHFAGVATVVLKLLNLVQPHATYFGQKDYQQAVVIRRMVEDLNVPVTIRVCPTVREADGLAMSSRNRYLSATQRRQAAVLWKSLRLAADMVDRGERDAATILRRMDELIVSAEDVQVDYVALADPETLEPVQLIAGPTVAAIAVRIGHTRLIDNHLLEPPRR